MYLLKLMDYAKVRVSNETKSGNRRTYNLKGGGVFVRKHLYDFQAECTHQLFDKHNYQIIKDLNMEHVIQNVISLTS